MYLLITFEYLFLDVNEVFLFNLAECYMVPGNNTTKFKIRKTNLLEY